MITIAIIIILGQTTLLLTACYKLGQYQQICKAVFELLEEQQRYIKLLSGKVEAMRDVYGKYTKN